MNLLLGECQDFLLEFYESENIYAANAYKGISLGYLKHHAISPPSLVNAPTLMLYLARRFRYVADPGHLKGHNSLAFTASFSDSGLSVIPSGQL